MSDLKATASRENGKKSTGPATEEGRAKSSRNATKLGIFSQARLLEEESAAEFEALLDAVRRPFDEADALAPYAEPADSAVTACYRTFCWT